MTEPMKTRIVHPAVASLFRSCFEIFGKRFYTEIDTYQEFFRAVNCQDPEQLIAALREWIATGNRFPLPTDIKRVIDAARSTSTSTAC